MEAGALGAREAGAATGIDIVLPVWGAAADLARCLFAVFAHTDLEHHRLVLVIDGPQDGSVEAALASTAEASPSRRIVVLRNRARRGFAASINRGLALSAGDVILLNSDTQVTARWVEKLGAAATSGPAVGTATPFSNHATICSLPRFLAENVVPAGHDVDSFGALVEGVATPTYPRLPTGVGFCLYVRRALLDRVGLLDEETFGLGYGEETDLCMRGTAGGFEHVLDDATYVWHRGHGSFGSARRARMRRASRAMRRRHPDYLAAVADFIRRDPLSPLRARVLAALAPPPRRRREEGPRRVLHVVHGWPPFNSAGTEVYAQGLARRQAAHRAVAAYARVAWPDRRSGQTLEHHDHGVRVRLWVNHFDQRNPLARNALHDGLAVRDFVRLLDEERPDLLHVHHLAGHCATLVGVARRRRIPVVYQLQDWWALCTRVNLLHRDGYLCPGPTTARCADCAPLTGRPPTALWNRLLHAARRRLFQRTLAQADAFVGGSAFVEASYRALGGLPREAVVHVLPYGIEALVKPPSPTEPGPATRPLRCGIIGSLMPHKGVHVAVEAFAAVAPEQATLEVWGDPAADPSYGDRLRSSAGPAVHFHGRFSEERKAAVFAGLDLLLVPSLGLESFGIVAREARAAGVPVLASRRGALVELFGGGDGGALVTPGDAAELRECVLQAAASPERIAAWRRGAPVPKSMDAHAEEIEAVYAGVCAGRAAASR